MNTGIKYLLDNNLLNQDQYNKINGTLNESIFDSLGKQAQNLDQQGRLQSMAFNGAMNHMVQQAQNVKQQINIESAKRNMNSGLSNLVANAQSQNNASNMLNLFENQASQSLTLQQNKESIGETLGETKRYLLGKN